MRVRFRPWQISLLMLAFCGAAVFVALWWRSRPASTVELAAHLPQSELLMLQIDVKALRELGLLDLLAGSKAVEESDYRTFVERSGFDYRRDLDTVLAALLPDRSYFLLRGRFDWKSLMEYAALEGGSCKYGLCAVQSGRSGRYVSFLALRHEVMAFAVSDNPRAASHLVERKQRPPLAEIPRQPIWLKVPGSTLRNSDWVPTGTRSYASLLTGAEEITLAFGPGTEGFEAFLDVSCRTPAEAALLVSRLEALTGMLRKLIARENQVPNPRDLSGVLAHGSFRSQDRRALGRWPIQQTFIESLVGGSL